jgi:recombination protein RecR
MLEHLPSLNQLLKNLQQVPYLASKNMYRVAAHFLHMDNDVLEQFCIILLNAKKNLIPCQTCYCWQELDRTCFFCSSTHREQTIVCVVEQWYDVLAIEKTNGYTGVYHVLGGSVNPLEGIGPDDLTIQALLQRVEQGIKEVILATNQTPEGEATAAYIASKLKNKHITVTCLARGLPVGSSLGSTDRVTIYKALSERRLF